MTVREHNWKQSNVHKIHRLNPVQQEKFTVENKSKLLPSCGNLFLFLGLHVISRWHVFAYILNWVSVKVMVKLFELVGFNCFWWKVSVTFFNLYGVFFCPMHNNSYKGWIFVAFVVKFTFWILKSLSEMSKPILTEWICTLVTNQTTNYRTYGNFYCWKTTTTTLTPQNKNPARVHLRIKFKNLLQTSGLQLSINVFCVFVIAWLEDF